MMTIIPKSLLRKPSGFPVNLPTDEVRRRFLKLLGPFEKRETPLKLCVTDEKLLRGGVIQQRVVYQVAPGESVPALHLFQHGIPRKAPGILAIHAHGGDEYFPVGKAKNCRPDLKDPEQYGYHAARAGFRVLAPDALCFGERQAQWGYATGFMDEIVTHAELSGRGKSLAWKSVWDNSRAIEVLETLGARSIGCLGHSGGSTQSYILAAVNPKVRAAACFFSFCTLRHQFYQYRLWHCLYHYIPGMIQAGIDWDDVVALAAPRRMFFGWGDKDEGSPKVMYRAFVKSIRKRCRAERLPCAVETYEEKGGPHKITGGMLAAAMAFLRKELA
jgi:dienelactone hydrolase